VDAKSLTNISSALSLFFMAIDLKYKLSEIFSQRVYNGEAFGLEM